MIIKEYIMIIIIETTSNGDILRARGGDRWVSSNSIEIEFTTWPLNLGLQHFFFTILGANHSVSPHKFELKKSRPNYIRKGTNDLITRIRTSMKKYWYCLRLYID